MGTESSPIWFIRRLVEGAVLYFLAIPIVAVLQIIGTPLSVGTGLPLPMVPPLFAGLVLVGVLLKRHYWR